MRKLGPAGLKWLKTAHIVLVALFFGGILSSVALNSWLNLSAPIDDVAITYKNLVVISDQVVRYGAQGTLLVGLLYGIFTNWGFFKYKWVAVKWVVFLAQTVIGIFVVDKLMMANVAILENEGAMALSNPAFIQNHSFRQLVVSAQIVLTLFLILISVFKPWQKSGPK